MLKEAVVGAVALVVVCYAVAHVANNGISALNRSASALDERINMIATEQRADMQKQEALKHER